MSNKRPSYFFKAACAVQRLRPAGFHPWQYDCLGKTCFATIANTRQSQTAIGLAHTAQQTSAIQMTGRKWLTLGNSESHSHINQKN